MESSVFNAIPYVLADAFRKDPNRYLPEFEFSESRRKTVIWQSPFHLRYGVDGKFGVRASDGNGSNILVDDEQYKTRQFLVFDGNGNSHMSFVAIYAAIHSVSEDEALDEAFRVYGVDRAESPEATRQREIRREIQGRFARVIEAAQLALKDDAPSEAKAYALSRFSSGDGVAARVGYVSPAVYGMIKELVEFYEDETGRKVRWAPKVVTGMICAPIVMFGKVYGFICRRVEKLAPEGETAPRDEKSGTSKYHNIVFYGAGEKPVYGLMRARKHGTREKANLVVVEGEFACMKVRAVTGLDNIVAISQSEISAYQANVIKDAGYESVTLFLDNDGFGKREANLKSLKASVSVLHANGLRVNAIRVEHDEDRKFAPDDEVMSENGGELVRGLINDASPAVFAIIEIIMEIYNARQGKSGTEYRALIDECIEAIALYTFDEIERASAVKLFVSAFGGKWGLNEMMVKASISKIEDKASEVKGKAIEDSRTQNALRLCQEAEENLLLGYQDNAKKSMLLANAALSEKHVGNFIRLLPPQDPEDIFQDVQIGDPIEMPFYLTPNGVIPDDEYERESYRYVITSSGIDLVSALTSHGKTRMLENIALNCIGVFQKRMQEKQVLFFTAEEVRPSIMCHFMSIRAGARMMKKGVMLGRYLKNPIVGIQKIVTTKDFGCVHDDEYNTAVKRDFAISAIKKSIEEVSGFVKSGMLSIFRENRISEIEKITLACERRMQVPVGAIFVDYAQIIQSESKFAQDPKLRMADVMNRLLLLAQATGAAVVVGSQLNRGKYTPLTMDCQNNALASDLEQIAFTDMLMWNSSGRLREDALWNESDEKVSRLKDLGFKLNVPGCIYARLGKNRRGDRGVWGVLSFDGPSGYISGNTKGSAKKQGNNNL